jgi:radical SAM/Cys-rich protein
MNTQEQLTKLSSYPASFEQRIAEAEPDAGHLTPAALETIQINVGARCNQACRHCHVKASPSRQETMSKEVAAQCLKIIEAVDEIKTVDITGGAPEMNMNFAYLVTESRRIGKHVIDRCNLTILTHPGYEQLDGFLAENEVELVASLPHYRESLTDRQRGNGVFERSIAALRMLNERGYGTDRILNIVYNPAGLYLSGSQNQLEREFREQLLRRYGIVFNNLYCINNFPIGRFMDALVRSGKFEDYMNTLVSAYNTSAVENLMCRRQISVGYDGNIYDCDFNQMLGIHSEPISHVADFDYDAILSRGIRVANHCFGCTAGAGSSCGGELTN